MAISGYEWPPRRIFVHTPGRRMLNKNWIANYASVRKLPALETDRKLRPVGSETTWSPFGNYDVAQFRNYGLGSETIHSRFGNFSLPVRKLPLAGSEASHPVG